MNIDAASISRRRFGALAAGGLWAGMTARGAGLQQENFTLAVEGDPGEPGRYGLSELEQALQSRGTRVLRVTGVDKAPEGPVVVAGIPSRSVRMREIVGDAQPALAAAPESYAIAPAAVGLRRVTAAAASDERGLMYALLELARRVNRLDPGISTGQWFGNLPPLKGSPAVGVRGMIQFLHNADLERSWYFDREYWEAYLGMLAKDRFNSFNLVFAHQTGYLAPPYPFLFDVEEHPHVRVPALSPADRKKNLETLQMISRLARERGIDFIMGIWEQRAWKRGQTNMVEGLGDDIITDYARLAVQKLLRLCPDITGIQLRVNPESGIDNSQQTRFYRDGVLAGIKAAGRPVLLDLRGWGALPETIAAAEDSGLPLRLSMKYWAEFMGMPYQPARMWPSYSYADFLRYPRRYRLIHQVWSLGSHRLLPWGSVEWLKRFGPTAGMGGAVGFETCAPLSQKGFGNKPGVWRIFVSPAHEYYRWEFQRYWLYYLLYGRLTYDPDTPEDVWMDEFRARFGAEGATDVCAAFQSAGGIIPFLVSYRLSNPNMYIWPEKQMGGLLDFYLGVRPADAARFATFDEYLGVRLGGAATAKMLPEGAARRLNRMADETERALARADRAVDPDRNREYFANRIDLTVLALLARYHARKVLAAANLALFYATGDESVLQYAQSHAAAGLEVWEQLVRLTDGLYYPNMVFGPQDVGHWKDNLVFVRHDVARLREVQDLLTHYELFDLGLDFGPAVGRPRSEWAPAYAESYSVERRFRPLDPAMLYSRERGYGWRDVSGITASPPMRIPYTSLEGDNPENLMLPAGVLYADFLRSTRRSTLIVNLPDGEYRVTAIVANRPELADGVFEIRAAQGSKAITYGLAETGDKSMDVSVSGGQLLLEFIPEADRTWLVSGLIIARLAPHIAHVPIRNAVPGSRVVISATITAPGGVAHADLQVAVDGLRKPIAVPLFPGGRQYAADFEWLRRWEGRTAGYFITAVDNAGHAARFPARGNLLVRIGRDVQAPVIAHEPVRTCAAGQPLRLSFDVRGSAPLAAARLYYRHLTQTEEYRVMDLDRSGGGHEATIPAQFITAERDLMYYAEAVDNLGNGSFYPDPDRTAPYVIVRIRR